MVYCAKSQLEFTIGIHWGKRKKLSYINGQKQMPSTDMVLVTCKASAEYRNPLPSHIHTQAYKNGEEEHKTSKDYEQYEVAKAERAHMTS